MSKKTYLQNQIKLMSLMTSDLFTPEEYECYLDILNIKTELANIDPDNKERKKELTQAKKDANARLKTLILANKDLVRTVSTRSVCDYKTFVNGKPPEYITWDNLKITKKITEFVSEESRAMGLKPNDITFDKVIINWKSLDVLRQIVVNGFYVPLEDGVKLFHFVTASAGQLRTDKIQCLSDDMWSKIKDCIMCGMTWEELNAKGGINVN